MYKTPLVVPSGMVFYTPLPGILVQKNPDLAKQVVYALNTVDRSRRELFGGLFPKERK